MGRIYTAPTINKSVINNAITSTLSAVYTNATGAGAELRAVNINGLQNNATINTTASGASEWTPFGSNINPIISYSSPSTYGIGEPYQVQLSANRVLLFFLPMYHHRCGGQDYMGGNTIHTQIVEYQTNKYVAGPIQTHTLPYQWFPDTSYNLWSRPDSSNSSWLQPCWRAIALTATKVVAVCQQRSTTNSKQIMRFTITGNTVDHTVTNLDMSTQFGNNTSYPFALDIVPDNTDKVIIASGASSGNWSAHAYNVPNTGAISAAGSLQSLGISISAYHIGMSKMVKTATANITPYLFAVTTAATTSQATSFNFNSSTNAWSTTTGAAAALITLTAISGNHTGLECACLSTGTGVNAVIAATTGSSPNDGIFTFYRQTNAVTLSTTRTSLTTQNTTQRCIAEHYQWGDERVVFVGEYGTLVSYDSAGNSYSLITPNDSINTTRYMTKWYPFNSRPLYVFYDNAIKDPFATGNYKARINSTGTTTSIGQLSHTGNYLPWGFDYGEGYAWNELAACWVVVQGNRIYSLSTAGVVLSEIPGVNLYSTLNYLYCLGQIQVTATGRLLLAWDYGIKVFPATGHSPHNSYSSFSASGFLGVTEPMTSSAQLTTLKMQLTPVQPTGNSNGSQLFGHMVYFTDGGGSEYAYILYISASSVQLRIAHFNGTTWADVNPTQIGTGYVMVDGGANSWTSGYRFNTKLIQDTPGSNALPKGLWRILGSYYQDGNANYSYNGISNAYSITTQCNSLSSSSNALSGNTSVGVTQGWGTPMHVHGGRSNTQVATIFDEVLGCNRVYASVNGRLNSPQGWYTPFAPVQVISTTITTNIITVTSTTGMYTNMAVRFNGNGFGNISIGATYYVLSGFTSTTFTVSATVGGSTFILTTATGSAMTVSYFTSNRWCQIATTKAGYAVTLQNTSQIDQQAFNYNFNTVDSLNPVSSNIATIGSGWFVLYRTGKNSWQLYNSTASINNTYTAYGIPDEVRFYLTLDDNAGNVFYLNNGQTLSPADTTTGLFRSETVYQIPNGYSIKAACDTPNVLALLLTIKESQ